MRRPFFLCLSSFLVCAVFLAKPMAAEHPLVQMARKIPADAAGWIVLNDVAASRRQLDLVDGAQATVEGQEKLSLTAFTPLSLPDGFDGSLLVYASEADLERRLGFSPLAVDQIGGWGEVPDLAVVMRSAAFEAADASVQAALSAWGHKRTDREGVPVFWRLDDSAVDPEQAYQDPFAGMDGFATRFALDGKWMYAARTWAAIDQTLADGVGLMESPATANILHAATMANVRGELLSVVILGEQLSRRDAVLQLLGPAATPRFVKIIFERLTADGVPFLPHFTRHAVFLWQDGTTFTTGIALGYPDAPTADAGLAALDRALENMPNLAGTGDRKIGELLPSDRSAQVVTTPTGAVALMTFSMSLADQRGRGVMWSLKHPGHRIFDLKRTQLLDLLLSGR